MAKRTVNKKAFIIFGGAILAVAFIIVTGILIKNTPSTDQKTANQKTFASFERFPNTSNRGKLVIDENYIWVANRAGVLRYDKKSREQKIFTAADGLLNNDTVDIVKHGDEIWIASNGRGINVLNTKNNTWKYFTRENGLPAELNMKMELDGDSLWLATFEGLGKYDFKTETWENWKEAIGINFSGVDDITINNEYVWIYISPDDLTKGGILRFDKKTSTWTDLAANNPAFKERQFSYLPLYLDNNFLYATANKKIYRLNIASNTWETFEKTEKNVNKFHIGAKKYENKYWNFNKKGNIEVFDPAIKKQEIIRAAKLKQCPTVYRDYGSEKGYFEDFTFDSGSIWLACHQGFAQFDMKNKKWIFHETKMNYPNGIYNILTIKNDTLVVDSNLGLGLFNPKKSTWKFIKLNKENFAWSKAIWINDEIYMVEDYMGMGGGTALWKYNVKSEQIDPITIERTENSEGPSSGNDFLHLTANNNLWFTDYYGLEEFDVKRGKSIIHKPNLGKEKSALWHFDDETKKWEQLEQDKRLRINDVQEKNNVIWIASDFGLVKFDPTSKEFEIIGAPPEVQLKKGKRSGQYDEFYHVLINNEDDGEIFVTAAAFDGKSYRYQSKNLYSYNVVSKTWHHIDSLESFKNLEFTYKKIILIGNYLIAPDYEIIPSAEAQNSDLFMPGWSKTNLAYERKGLKAYNMKNKTWRFLTTADGMLDSEIHDFYQDGNTVWLVNNRAGIWKLNFTE